MRGAPEGEFHSLVSRLRDRAEKAARGFVSVEVGEASVDECYRWNFVVVVVVAGGGSFDGNGGVNVFVAVFSRNISLFRAVSQKTRLFRDHRSTRRG